MALNGRLFSLVRPSQFYVQIFESRLGRITEIPLYCNFYSFLVLKYNVLKRAHFHLDFQLTNPMFFAGASMDEASATPLSLKMTPPSVSPDSSPSASPSPMAIAPPPPPLPLPSPQHPPSPPTSPTHAASNSPFRGPHRLVYYNL